MTQGVETGSENINNHTMMCVGWETELPWCQSLASVQNSLMMAQPVWSGLVISVWNDGNQLVNCNVDWHKDNKQT